MLSKKYKINYREFSSYWDIVRNKSHFNACSKEVCANDKFDAFSEFNKTRKGNKAIILDDIVLVEKPKYWYEYKIVAFDVETTGLSPESDSIIEIGFSEYNKETKSFDKPESYLVKEPNTKVSAKITELTGITNNMLSEAKPFKETYDQFNLSRYFENDDVIIVTHNRGFDSAFLYSALDRIGVESRPFTVCSMELSKKLYPNEKGHKLETLQKRLNLKGSNTHRAGDDAELCGQAFLALTRRCPYLHNLDIIEFVKFFNF